LELVNTERAAAGVSTLARDELAGTVAERHARDMAAGKFLSHWGSDGRKAYHRYAFAGGVDAVAENVSAASNMEGVSREYISLTLAQAHRRMHAEVAPNDGHRKTILAPQHTHVGFGVALSGRELWLVELYVAKHVQIDPYPHKSRPKATMEIKGRVLSDKHTFYYAEVFYEPPPQPPETAWLQTPRGYGFPDVFSILRPKLSDGTLYADGIKGTIDLGNRGGFRIPVKLDQELPGIYTVVIWIAKRNSRERIPVTNICIQAE
jgi:hypothetical protein